MHAVRDFGIMLLEPQEEWNHDEQIPSWLLLIFPGVLVVLSGAAISAQDKYTFRCRVGSHSPSSGDTKTGQ